MDYFEFYSWSQRWFMDNFPPLPLVKFESPCYDPYEIDPSHYSDISPNNLEDDFYYNNYNHQDNYYHYHYDNESDLDYKSSESDLEEDPHDFH